MDRTEQIIKSLNKAVELLSEGDCAAAKANILMAISAVQSNHTELDGILCRNMKAGDNNPDGLAFINELKSFLASK